MVRNIINIDEELCIGCGLCVNACKESAIQLINGKAKLVRDDYCDGLGNCLPVCPTNAISFETRKALPFDKEQVLKHQAKINKPTTREKPKKEIHGGCPGSKAKVLDKSESMLNQWPVQIKLVMANASFFNKSKLLIAADCTAYAHRNFHSFMKDKITLIGCPKLDEGDYADKLTEILSLNDIASITVAKMEVPCCNGILNVVQTAMKRSNKIIPWRLITITTDGEILEDL